MSEQENSDKLKGETNAGAGKQPDDELLPIYLYRETLQGLWKLIMHTDWSELRSEAKEIKNIEEQLRDVMENIQELRAEPVGKKVTMDKILMSIKDALKEIYRVKDLIKREEGNPQVQALTYDQKDKYDKIESCMDAIENAFRQMPSRPQTTIVAPSVQAVSGDGEKTTKAG